jgi:hypothetical protein
MQTEVPLLKHFLTRNIKTQMMKRHLIQAEGSLNSKTISVLMKQTTRMRGKYTKREDRLSMLTEEIQIDPIEIFFIITHIHYIF